MSEREELAAVLEGPYAAGVYAQDGRRISTAGRFLTQGDAESVAGIFLASSWLRAHDDRIRAEALQEAAVTMSGIGSHRDPCRLPDTECLCGVCDFRAEAAAALRAAAGTPTHHTTKEDT